MAFVLTPDNLNIANLELILREKPQLELPQLAISKNAEPTLPAEKAELALAYLSTHAVSFGPFVPDDVVRLALVLQLYTFIQPDQSEINPAVLQRVLAFYNREVFPVVQTQGSPTSQAAQLCLPLLGKGKVSFQGYTLNAADVNDIFSWEPLALAPAEINLFITQPSFTYAETVNNLIKLQPQLAWLAYLLEVLSQLTPPEAPFSAGIGPLQAAATKARTVFQEQIILPVAQQNLGLLRDALLIILTELKHVIGALSDYTSETLENLYANAEPPATTGFQLASALVQSHQKRLNLVAPNPTEVVFTRGDLNIINHLFSQAVDFTEQLTALAFWTVAQVGRVFNITAGNLTLSTYYHSALFVPKEMVSEQLEKTITFIRSTSPNPVT